VYGLGSPEVAAQARRAHEQAITQALGYLERHAAIVSRGHARERQELVGGFLAAAYLHRTSRAGDPLLHTHVLVAAMGRGADGRWTALDARALYTHAKTAGYLYQAVLRAELTRRLGVEWGPVRQGAADIAGVPRGLVEAFSQRREQIRRWLVELGCSSARAAQRAALATRPAKELGVGEATLRGRWRQRAEALGFTARDLVRCLHRVEVELLTDSDAAQVAERLVSPQGLTLRVSTFTRREVLRGICQALGGGGSVAEIERLADQLLQGNQQVVPVGVQTGGRMRGLLPVDQRCYSTRELLAVEAGVVATGLRGRGQAAGVVPAPLVAAALSLHPQLSAEQADMVRALTGSGDGVQLVNAKAGTGKTFALRAARVAWEQAGYRVVGAALAARAARELQQQAGIPSGTITQLLADLDDPRGQGLGAGTVLVVDEAGMVGTRTLARLLGQVERAGAKVVLCGDAAQLPEIDAGGTFRALCRRLGAVDLQINRRQRQAWERDALDALRRGDAVAAMVAYLAHGRVVLRRRADPLRHKLVADWWQATHLPGEQPPVMLAARRADVADLNARARGLMAANGRLGPDTLRVGGREFAVGDRVVTLRNNFRLGVLNGTRGRVAWVDPVGRSLGIRRDDDGAVVHLPSWYLHGWGGCWIDYGYAMTGTRAQGMTCDRAFVLGTDQLYREWGYVAMSRARLETRLYVAVGDRAGREPELDGPRERIDQPMLELARTLERSGAKWLALEQLASQPRELGGP
jgi:hypothetical protein